MTSGMKSMIVTSDLAAVIIVSISISISILSEMICCVSRTISSARLDFPSIVS